MPGLDPGIHAFGRFGKQDVDGRVKPGHDGEKWQDSIIPRHNRERAFDEVADRLPGIAVELHQAQLLDGTEIRRPGIDGDARQRHRSLVIPQRRGLPAAQMRWLDRFARPAPGRRSITNASEAHIEPTSALTVTRSPSSISTVVVSAR
jgi:hypothetical protein